MTDTLSTLMASFLILLFLLSGAASDTLVVTVDPGDDVILQCQAADSSISAAQWSRPDLVPDYVLLTIDGHLDTTHQHPSYKDRVELVDRDLKDGDVSLILKNVSSNDNGTYECRVKPDESRRKKRAFSDLEPIRIIRLQVTEPGQESGHSKDENSMNDIPEDGISSPVGRDLGLAAGALILVTAAVVGVLMYRGCNTPSVPPAATDEAPATTLV